MCKFWSSCSYRPNRGNGARKHRGIRCSAAHGDFAASVLQLSQLTVPDLLVDGLEVTLRRRFRMNSHNCHQVVFNCFEKSRSAAHANVDLIVAYSFYGFLSLTFPQDDRGSTDPRPCGIENGGAPCRPRRSQHCFKFEPIWTGKVVGVLQVSPRGNLRIGLKLSCALAWIPLRRGSRRLGSDLWLNLADRILVIRGATPSAVVLHRWSAPRRAVSCR